MRIKADVVTLPEGAQVVQVQFQEGGLALGAHLNAVDADGVAALLTKAADQIRAAQAGIASPRSRIVVPGVGPKSMAAAADVMKAVGGS